MKIRRLIAFTFMLLMLQACENNDATTTEVDPLEGNWNLVNVSGGFAGINEDFDKGSIVWNFNVAQGTLQVIKNGTPNTIYDGISAGDYVYEMVDHNGNTFLFIDNLESGGVSLSNVEMVINQNLMINGSGADKFVLRLVK